jgi:hypothetical protein
MVHLKYTAALEGHTETRRQIYVNIGLGTSFSIYGTFEKEVPSKCSGCT